MIETVILVFYLSMAALGIGMQADDMTERERRSPWVWLLAVLISFSPMLGQIVGLAAAYRLWDDWMDPEEAAWRRDHRQKLRREAQREYELKQKMKGK